MDSLTAIENNTADAAFILRVLESFALPAIIVREDRQVVYLNDAARAKYAGNLPADRLPTCCQLALGRDELTNICQTACPVRACLESGQPAKYVHRFAIEPGKFQFASVSCYPLRDPQTGLRYGLTLHNNFRDDPLPHDDAEASQHYRISIQTSIDGFWRIDGDGNLLDVNDAYCQLLGYTREELLSKHISEIDVDESTAEVRQHIQQILETGYDLFETRHRHKNGELIDVEISVTFSREFGSFFAFIRDIRERRRAESALRDSQQRFASLFDNVPISIWEEDFSAVKAELERIKAEGVTDLDEYLRAHPELVTHCISLVRILGINRTTFEMLQFESADDLFADLGKVLTPSSMEAIRQQLLAIWQGRTSISLETYQRTGTGREIPILLKWAVPPGHTASYDRVLISFTDLTQRKKAELERDLLFSRSTDGLCIAGFDGYFKQINPALVEMIGWPKQDIMSKPWLDFVHPDDRGNTKQAGAQLAQGLPVFNFENRYVRENGTYRWLSWDSFPDVHRQEIFGVIRDVTQVKATEEELRRVQMEKAELEGIQKTAATYAHEINNPLTGVMGLLELIANTSANPEDTRQMAVEALQAARRIKEVTAKVESLDRPRSRSYLDKAQILDLDSDS
ncbi:PAS domain S-box protein [bacterium]|nr:PAS domain S-box protein [bacterium]